MKRKIPILYFHSVAPHKNPLWYKNYLTFNYNYFIELIKRLVQSKYEFLFLDEYYDLIEKNGDTKKYICLTFDDGYLDNYVYVYPILKRYEGKGTIFVNPEYVQERSDLRPTLLDFDLNNKLKEEIEDLGFISWTEMLSMENSGVIDIQSHTLTHTKYISSEIIREFHHPNSNYLYPIANQYPNKKPYYITDSEFKYLIPFGTPFFQEKSALITKLKLANPEFVNIVVSKLKNYNWKHYNYKEIFNFIKPYYRDFLIKDKLFIYEETSKEYETRVKNELLISKSILEEKLSKKIRYCCWPHGDYDSFTKEIAYEVGYKATTEVRNDGTNAAKSIRRIAGSEVLNSKWLSVNKIMFNIHAFEGRGPYYQIKNIYRYLRRNYE